LVDESHGSLAGAAAVSARLDQAGYSIRGLANWILDFADSRGQQLTNMAINKLAFFAYEAVLLRKSKMLTKAKIEAWDHGPVFRELYQDFKKYGDRAINGRASFYSVQTGNIEVSQVHLSLEDESEIVSALSPLIGLRASQLRDLSHVEGGAWHTVWAYEGHANPGMEITPELILEAATPARGGKA
jgi:uncharacterized phage-associated protein